MTRLALDGVECRMALALSHSECYYVSAEDEEAAKGLAGVIGGAEVQQSDYYAGQTEDGQKQLTIVIGVDRAASAPETPAS
ncbi:hypothetical protein CTI14_52195 [Methylobacterium radiotolerans]|nr:hypothetical protein CTI14_52195 [Methylobacterium radiotolerans]